jgi:transcriptional regulator with XRE-family HTH domain
VRNPVGASAFGNRLRALRKVKKLSQQRLATEAEVAIVTIKRLEIAETSPSLDVLISISRALGIHLYELLRDDNITDGDSNR